MHISIFLFGGLFVPFLLHGYVIVKRRQLESAVFDGQLSEVKDETPLLENPDGTLTHDSQPSSS